MRKPITETTQKTRNGLIVRSVSFEWPVRRIDIQRERPARAGYLHIQTIRRSDCVMPSFFCIRREAVLVFSTWPKGI